MRVKLLPKSELSALKAKQASREIQEGVKIATRVDGLRELWAKTEQDFDAYRTATLSAIQKEIDALGGKRDSLSGELREMRKKYDAMLPGIPVKRKELAQLERNLQTMAEKLDEREHATVSMEIDVANAMKKAEDSVERNLKNESASANALAQSVRNKEESENLLQSTRKIRETAEREKEEAERYFDMRESGIKAREDAILVQQVGNARVARENALERIRITDQWAQLQRTADKLRQERIA